jgi:thiol-disulfide isomerase/thioredoxin
MPMRLGTVMPSLEGATEWFNAEGFDPTNFREFPLLVHFRSVSCHICHEVMPEVVAYKDQYREHGLRVVGVHMPKQESDLDVEKVKQDIQTFRITQPVAVDNTHAITDAFENQFVPAFFLFDKEGKLFFRAAGDKGFQNLKPKIEQVLGLSQE